MTTFRLWLLAQLFALFTRDDEPIPYRVTPTRIRFVIGDDTRDLVGDYRPA